MDRDQIDVFVMELRDTEDEICYVGDSGHCDGCRSGNDLLTQAANVIEDLTTWRPISQAPRDGTWILMLARFQTPTDPLKYRVARWVSEPANATRGPWEGWLSERGFHVLDDLCFGWLPLVPGPEVGE